jgi:flagellar hook-length control protein FliK
MNNISGFSNALLTTTQFSTSDSTSGSDLAAPDQQSDAFGDVLAGLSQKSDTQPGSSSGPNSGGWTARSDLYSGGDGALNEGNSFGDGRNPSEAGADEISAHAHTLSQNPARSSLSSGKLADSNGQLISLYGTQPKAGSQPPGLPASAGAPGRSLSGSAIGSAAAPLISGHVSAEDGGDIPASSAAPTNPASENLSKIVSKSGAQPPAIPQPPAKPQESVRTPPLLGNQRQVATAGANTSKPLRPDSLASAVIASTIQHRTQTAASSSPSPTASADRRRRAEADSGQTPAAANADSQMGAAAMAMAAVAPVAPFAASNIGSPPFNAAPSHGLPGANIDPAKAILTALDAEPAHEDHEHPAVPIKVDAVSHTTHFAPVAWLSPSQQVVNVVSSALSSDSTAASEDRALASPITTSSASLNSLTATSQPSSSSLKTLDLQLDPEDLGAVTIRLNLSATGLTVEVQASQIGTADLLEKDKRALTDGLSNAGYAVSGVEIGFAPASGTATGFTDQGLAQNSSGQSLGSDSQGNGGSQTQDGSTGDSFSRQNPKQDSHGTAETARSAAQRPAGSSLYI